MPRGSGFKNVEQYQAGFAIVGMFGAGLSQKTGAAARSLVVPGNRGSRQGALPQRILR